MSSAVVPKRVGDWTPVSQTTTYVQKVEASIDPSHIQHILERTVEEKRISAFYNRHKLAVLAQKIANSKAIPNIVEGLKIPYGLALDFSRLALYDVWFYLDDSASMTAERRAQLANILAIAAKATTNFAPNGINIRFVNDNAENYHVQNSKQAEQVLGNVAFNGSTPLGTELHRKIVEDIVYFAEKGALKKPVLIITITDGAPTGEQYFKIFDVVDQARARLANTQFGADSICYQVAQVGEDKEAAEFLEMLDRAERIGKNIDVTGSFQSESHSLRISSPSIELTWELWVSKLLLGAIDPVYDGSNEASTKIFAQKIAQALKTQFDLPKQITTQVTIPAHDQYNYPGPAISSAPVIGGILKNAIYRGGFGNFYSHEQLHKLTSHLSSSAGLRNIVEHLRLPLQVALDYSKLALYDVWFYIDDSGSMDGQRQAEIRKFLSFALTVLGYLNHTGVNVRFMNSAVVAEKITSVAQLDAVLGAVSFTGGTPLGTQLKAKIVAPLVKKAFESKLERPVLVVVVTDGEPNEEDPWAVRSVIEESRAALQGTPYGAHAISYQFGQIGNDAKATAFFEAINEQLGSHVDVTSGFEREASRTPFPLTKELYASKLLLGAIDPAYSTTQNFAKTIAPALEAPNVGSKPFVGGFNPYFANKL